MTHEDMLAAVRELYRARKDGDFTSLGRIAAPDSEFSFNGIEEITRAFPGGTAKDVAQVARELFDGLEMVSLELVESLAGERKLATLWNGGFRYDGGRVFETRLYDLWTFDEQGRISGGLQFFDTALLAREMGLAVDAAMA
jgi:ketosteroid isomerase-like protein